MANRITSAPIVGGPKETLTGISKSLQSLISEWNNSAAKFLNNFTQGREVLKPKTGYLDIARATDVSGNTGIVDFTVVPVARDADDKNYGGGYFWHKIEKRPLSIAEAVQSFVLPESSEERQVPTAVEFREEGLSRGSYRQTNTELGVTSSVSAGQGDFSYGLKIVKDGVTLSEIATGIDADFGLRATVSGRKVTLDVVKVPEGSGCTALSKSLDVIYVPQVGDLSGFVVGLNDDGYIDWGFFPFQAVAVASGASDEGKIVALSSSGYINMNFIPGPNTDATLDPGGSIIWTLPDGTIDPSWLPSIIGGDIENIAPGSDVFRVRAFEGITIPEDEPPEGAAVLYSHTDTSFDYSTRGAPASLFDPAVTGTIAFWDFSSSTYYDVGTVFTDQSGGGRDATVWPTSVFKHHWASPVGMMAPGKVCLSPNLNASGTNNGAVGARVTANLSGFNVNPYTFQAWLLLPNSSVTEKTIVCHHNFGSGIFALKITITLNDQYINVIYQGNGGAYTFNQTGTYRVPKARWFLFTFLRTAGLQNRYYINKLGENLGGVASYAPDNFAGVFTLGGKTELSGSSLDTLLDGHILTARVISAERSEADIFADVDRGLIF